MNRWRYVGPANDGCEVYQCLTCKQTWESRTQPVQRQHDGTHYGQSFCGWCGIKFDGELEWKYNERQFYPIKQFIACAWKIEERLSYQTHGTLEVFRDWTQHQIIVGNYRYVKFYLDSCRENNNSNRSLHLNEYRAVVVQIQNPNSVDMWQSQLRFDAGYHTRYQQRWGGKMHHSKHERYWH